jgi:hypothetical protein
MADLAGERRAASLDQGRFLFDDSFVPVAIVQGSALLLFLYVVLHPIHIENP